MRAVIALIGFGLLAAHVFTLTACMDSSEETQSKRSVSTAQDLSKGSVTTAQGDVDDDDGGDDDGGDDLAADDVVENAALVGGKGRLRPKVGSADDGVDDGYFVWGTPVRKIMFAPDPTKPTVNIIFTVRGFLPTAGDGRLGYTWFEVERDAANLQFMVFPMKLKIPPRVEWAKFALKINDRYYGGEVRNDGNPFDGWNHCQGNSSQKVICQGSVNVARNDLRAATQFSWALAVKTKGQEQVTYSWPFSMTGFPAQDGYLESVPSELSPGASDDRYRYYRPANNIDVSAPSQATLQSNAGYDGPIQAEDQFIVVPLSFQNYSEMRDISISIKNPNSDLRTTLPIDACAIDGSEREPVSSLCTLRLNLDTPESNCNPSQRFNSTDEGTGCTILVKLNAQNFFGGPDSHVALDIETGQFEADGTLSNVSRTTHVVLIVKDNALNQYDLNEVNAIVNAALTIGLVGYVAGQQAHRYLVVQANRFGVNFNPLMPFYRLKHVFDRHLNLNAKTIRRASQFVVIPAVTDKVQQGATVLREMYNLLQNGKKVAEGEATDGSYRVAMAYPNGAAVGTSYDRSNQPYEAELVYFVFGPKNKDGTRFLTTAFPTDYQYVRGQEEHYNVRFIHDELRRRLRQLDGEYAAQAPLVRSWDKVKRPRIEDNWTSIFESIRGRNAMPPNYPDWHFGANKAVCPEGSRLIGLGRWGNGKCSTQITGDLGSQLRVQDTAFAQNFNSSLGWDWAGDRDKAECPDGSYVVGFSVRWDGDIMMPAKVLCASSMKAANNGWFRTAKCQERWESNHSKSLWLDRDQDSNSMRVCQDHEYIKGIGSHYTPFWGDSSLSTILCCPVN